MSSGHRDVADRLKTRLAEIDESDATSSDARRAAELDQQSVGRLSRTDALQMQSMAQCQERRRHVEQDRVEAALLRLESGEYGYCVVCGDEIGLNRLEFDPAATTCIRCAGRRG